MPIISSRALVWSSSSSLAMSRALLHGSHCTSAIMASPLAALPAVCSRPAFRSATRVLVWASPEDAASTLACRCLWPYHVVRKLHYLSCVCMCLFHFYHATTEPGRTVCLEYLNKHTSYDFWENCYPVCEWSTSGKLNIWCITFSTYFSTSIYTIENKMANFFSFFAWQERQPFSEGRCCSSGSKVKK